MVVGPCETACEAASCWRSVQSLQEPDACATDHVEQCARRAARGINHLSYDTHARAISEHPNVSRLHIGIARIHEMLCETEKSVDAFKVVLNLDAANVELANTGHDGYRSGRESRDADESAERRAPRRAA